MRTPSSTVQEGTHFAIHRNHSPFCLRRNSRVAVWNVSVFPSASKPMILRKRGQISQPPSEIYQTTCLSTRRLRNT